jgi:hypothetical protein
VQAGTSLPATSMAAFPDWSRQSPCMA